MHKHDKVKGGTMAIVEQDIRLYIGCYQKQNQTLTKYFKLFKAQCDVIDVFGGKAGYHRGLYQQTLKDIMKRQGETVETKEL